MPQTKFLLDESDIPKHWYNVVADMPNPPTRRWVRTDNPSAEAFGADLSHGPDRAGSLGRTLDSNSRAGARSLALVPALTTNARANRLEACWARRPRLFTIRRCFRLPVRTRSTPPSAGLLQQAGRYQATLHRDRCGAMGFGYLFAGNMFGLKCACSWCA